MARHSPLSLPKKLLFSAITLGIALVLFEGALALLPRLYVAAQGVRRPTEVAQTWLIFTGDSVTAGFGVGRQNAYPTLLGNDLKHLGLTGYGTFNVAMSGSGLEEVGAQVRDALAQTPMKVRPVVLAMVGHNDLMNWSNHHTPQNPDTVQGPQGIGDGPRLLRLLRWFGTAASGAVPRSAMGPDWEQHMTSAIQKLGQQIGAAGGRLYLLTYANPGQPSASDHSPNAQLIAATRRGQTEVNNTLRLAAAHAAVPLVDVERVAKLPETYDPTLFLDNIHLTIEGHQRLAQVVRQQLTLHGELPPDLLDPDLAAGR